MTLLAIRKERRFTRFPIPLERVAAYTRQHSRQPGHGSKGILDLILAGLVRLAGRLSWEQAYQLGHALGMLFYRLRIRRRVAMVNLTIAYGDTIGLVEKERIYRGCLINFGRVIINHLRLPYQGPTFWSMACRFEQEKQIQELFNRQKGVIFVAGHIGMMDLAGGRLGMSGYPVAAVAKPMKNQAVDGMIIRARNAMNVGTISHKRSARRILRGLKNGEGIIMILDQNMKRDQSIFIDWLGYPASATSAAAFFARKTKSPVIAGYLLQHGPKQFELRISDPIAWEAVPGNGDRELLVNTQRQADVLQAVIRRHPELWFWIHRRWKVQPEGTAEPYETSRFKAYRKRIRKTVKRWKRRIAKQDNKTK